MVDRLVQGRCRQPQAQIGMRQQWLQEAGRPVGARLEKLDDLATAPGEAVAAPAMFDCRQFLFCPRPKVEQLAVAQGGEVRIAATHARVP
jgi:hypothetical protein